MGLDLVSVLFGFRALELSFLGFELGFESIWASELDLGLWGFRLGLGISDLGFGIWYAFF